MENDTLSDIRKKVKKQLFSDQFPVQQLQTFSRMKLLSKPFSFDTPNKHSGRTGWKVNETKWHFENKS